MSRPVLILSAPRSYSSVLGTMLGQHPALYGLPEVKLFLQDTVGSLVRRFKFVHVQRLHGLYRVIAEVEFGGQTDDTIAQAERWLHERRSWKTAQVWDHIAAKVAPLELVEAAPVTAMFDCSLERSFKVCPDARFIHLTRHPKPSYRSIKEIIEWMDHRYHSPFRFLVDPEAIWARCHDHILRFLETVPSDQVLRVHGEDLMRDAPALLRRISAFLGVETDDAAVEAMMHPEHSTYAALGPKRAPLGHDPKFLDDPRFRPTPCCALSLDGPRAPGQRALRPNTIRIAEQLGYH